MLAALGSICMNRKLKLFLVFLFLSAASLFAAYNTVWYGLVNPSNPTRIPTEIARTWVDGAWLVAFGFFCISLYSLYLLIKAFGNADGN